MTVVYGSPEARAFQAEHPAIDLHADTLMWSRWVGYDMTQRHAPPFPNNAFFGQVDLPRIADGLICAQFFGLVSLPLLGSGGCFGAVDQQINILERLIGEHPHALQAARTDLDIAKICGSGGGALAALLGIEGAHALEGKVDHVAHFARRGVRYLGLSHFSANEACVPAKGRGSDPNKGLSAFGREVVAACEQHGVMVDLAHINRKGFMEACAMARKPIIVSHTGVAGAYKHWRNIDDLQLQAVANLGGIIGVIFVPTYLGGPDIADVVRHMDHIVNVVGEDHVALGSDYDGMVIMTPQLAEISMLPNLTDALLAAKWPVERIIKVLRSNVLRVLHDAPPSHRAMLMNASV